ncbi:tetratricopeptide repeat protein [Microbulbifer sp. JMSA003]|uniref:tetratricopeptide repeat protein n=1 Tax=unclassified Microbulbifer TaxID=2619833 RepID=UPI00403A4AB8
MKIVSLSVLVFAVSQTLGCGVKVGVGSEDIGQSEGEAQCRELVKKENYLEARGACEASANQGSAYSMYALGTMYSNGLGGKESKEAAYTFYKKASDKGHAPSQYNLAAFYQQGLIVEQSSQKAFALVGKASEKNYEVALADLSVRYKSGVGVEVNEQKALAYLKQAAYIGDGQSMYNYGYAMIEGAYGEKDSDGIVWMVAGLELGANQGLSSTELFNEFGLSSSEGQQIHVFAKQCIDMVQKNQAIARSKYL